MIQCSSEAIQSKRKQYGPVRAIAKYLHASHMQRFGIANTMQIAKSINRLRFKRQETYRRDQFRDRFDDLITDNGGVVGEIGALQDGWCLDTSMSNPRLQSLLDQSREIIEKFGRIRNTSPGAYRSFFQNILPDHEVPAYPAVLDFALSSEVLFVVSSYLKCIPALSRCHPEGIRLAESFADFDDQPDTLRDSQLYHIDYYSRPNVYVIVALEEITEECGPFRFLPASVSRKAAGQLKYWSRKKPYRLSDEELYDVVDPDDVITFSGRPGSILFIDPSTCFHYGSRNSVQPRYQLMLGYTTAVRTDLSEEYLRNRVYSARPGDSRLARMVLDRRYLP